MSITTTLNLRSPGRICQETGIPYALFRRIVQEQGIRPTLVLDGIQRFDDAAFELIVAAHAAATNPRNVRREAMA
jgi:hypothetical protein